MYIDLPHCVIHAADDEGENRELTAQEEKDIEALLATSDWGNLDVDVFSKRLHDELAAIESVCICINTDTTFCLIFVTVKHTCHTGVRGAC